MNIIAKKSDWEENKETLGLTAQIETMISLTCAFRKNQNQNAYVLTSQLCEV